MNYIKQKSALHLVVALLMVALMLSSCAKQEFINIDDAKYVLTFSQGLKPRAKLVFIDKDGNNIGTYAYKGQAISWVNFYDNLLYMHSVRLNKHFTLDKNNTLEQYSLFNDKYENSKGNAAWFVAVSDGTLLETMNIGSYEYEGKRQYLSSLVYNEGDEQREVVFPEQTLEGGICYDNKIFVSTYFDDENRNDVSVIDRADNLVKRVGFKNSYTANGKEFLIFKDKVFIYGDNLPFTFEQEKASAIGMIDPVTYDTKEYNVDDGFIVFAYVYDDKLCVLTTENVLYQFDGDLELIQKISLEENDFMKNFVREDFDMSKLILAKDNIAVLYTTNDFDSTENIGFIEEYDYSTLNSIRMIPVEMKGEKRWLGEHVDMTILE